MAANALARNTYNAKNLPLGRPDIAAQNYGVDRDNVFEKFGKIWNDRTTEDGGSKQIYDKLVQWSSPEAIVERDPRADPNGLQWTLIREALNTGKLDPRINPDTLLRGMGTGLSETARFQQHKPQSLLGKIAGPLVTLGLAAIPGVGPYLAAGAGGYFGQKNGGGVLGGLLGAAGGYLGGQSIANAGGVSGIYSSAKNSLGSLFGSGGFSNPSALGLSGSNLGLNFASAPGAFTAAPVAGYGASGLGLTGANLGLNFASLPGAFNAAPVQGYGPSAVGGDPKSLYNPESMGGPKPDKGNNFPTGAPGVTLPPPQGGGGGPAIGGETVIPNSLTPPPPTTTSLPGPTFDPVLMSGGKSPQNNLALSGMGAGLMPDRGQGRVPGYQLRTFGNYLMRP